MRCRSMYARTNTQTHTDQCVGWNATLIRDNGQTWQGWQCCHTKRGRKEGWWRKRQKEWDKASDRERGRERKKEGRKEETPNSSADTEETKGRKWMRAHASSRQLWDTPPPSGPPLKLEASPFCFSHSFYISFFSSGGWCWGAQDIIFSTWCNALPS